MNKKVNDYNRKHDYDPKKHKDAKIEKIYVYENADGKMVCEKERLEGKIFRFRHKDKDGKYVPNLKGITLVPYLLAKWKDTEEVLITEGEKDADAMAAMGFSATCAPFGAGSWPKELTSWFKDKKVHICYDVGNESKATMVADKLLSVAKEVFIINLPSKIEEYDLSDYLAENSDRENPDKKIEAIANLYIKYTTRYEDKKEHRIYTARELMEAKFAERDIFVQEWIERNCLTILGGMKGTGKSMLILNLMIALAQGKPFLGFSVSSPRCCLYIQQEMPASGMKERLKLMSVGQDVELLAKNLHIINSRSNPYKLPNESHKEKIFQKIGKINPDLLALDHLTTLHYKSENSTEQMNIVLDILFDITHRFEIGTLLVHHHGKPGETPRISAHDLRGASVISDRADNVISIYPLPEKYKKDTVHLPYHYANYAEIRFTLRMDAPSDNIMVERDPYTLIYSKSHLYGQMGKKSSPDNVRDIVLKNGGEMRQTLVEEELGKDMSRKIALKYIDEAEKKGLIVRIPLPEKGTPNLLVLKDMEANAKVRVAEIRAKYPQSSENKEEEKK